MVWIENQLVGAYEGQTLTLECHSEAYPRPITYWTRPSNETIANGELFSRGESSRNLVTYTHAQQSFSFVNDRLTKGLETNFLYQLEKSFLQVQLFFFFLARARWEVTRYGSRTNNCNATCRNYTALTRSFHSNCYRAPSRYTEGVKGKGSGVKSWDTCVPPPLRRIANPRQHSPFARQAEISSLKCYNCKADSNQLRARGIVFTQIPAFIYWRNFGSPLSFNPRDVWWKFLSTGRIKLASKFSICCEGRHISS